MRRELTDMNARNSMAANATLHCLTGCAIGEIAGLMIGTAIGLSTGATIALAGEDPAAVLRRADEALYCSKQQGRDRLSFDGGPCQGLLASGPVMLP